ncbi:MAG: SYNERG-CTERM sorting domain-containing protein, partial [Synergistaceae bacterium]|nr:SYNERG-CTERM sorting domain-containing protein [Synergistaceae bacterium]
EDQLGDATKGYKSVGFEVPSNVTMPAEDTPIFVLVMQGTRRHIGFGYMPKRRPGFERIFAIMFNLFRDPYNTSRYMEVDAGQNNVGVTDSNGTTSGDTPARVNRIVFVTADGPAFAMQTNGTVPLQGQKTDGTATEIVTPSGDDDTDTDTDTDTDSDSDNPTSSRGGSSGCDAGFGALALLAVAGALAARKVRK